MKESKIKTENKERIVALFSILTTTVYPIFFMYFKNIFEARERHLIVITLVYLVISAFATIILYLFKKNMVRTAFIANMVLTILYNFEFFVSLFGAKTYSYIICSVLSIAGIILIIYLSKILLPDTIHKLNGIWAFTIIVLLVMDFIPAAPHMKEKLVSQLPSAQSGEIVTDTPVVSDPVQNLEETESDHPNVYLMIFDEYGGYENLLRYYDFDNSDFLSEMEDLGFNVSKSSFNVESISTITNVPNLFNLDYVVDHKEEEATYLTYLRNPYIYRFFKEHGYTINTTSYPAFLDDTQSAVSYDNRELYEDTVGYFILKNSLLIHVYDGLIAPNMNGSEFSSNDNTGTYLIEAMNFYKGFSKLNDKGPNFNLGYFSCPHIPLCFKSDGTPISSEEVEEDFAYCYIEYLKWANIQIKDIASGIIADDPDSIIIIMSDHGSRTLVNDEDKSLTDPDHYKENILNCVYMKGEDLDIEGLTGINTLITVLNTEYDMDIPFKEYTK